MVIQGIKYIQKEWNIIMATPLTFIVILIMACIIAYTISRWRYGKVVEISRERNNLLKERYAAKSAQLEEIIGNIKSKEIIQSVKSNAQNKLIKTELSFEIDRILKKLQDFWGKYQKISKHMRKYGRIVKSLIPLTTIPAQFKHVFPELHQEVLKATLLIDVKAFYYKIEDIEFMYKELHNQSKQDFELTSQWKELVAEVLERGNPLKKHNKSLESDHQGCATHVK